MIRPAYSVRRADWFGDGDALRGIRTQVFILEQSIPPEEEWDALDPACLHVLALDVQSKPVGTGRLTPDGQIGRMAVLKDWRGRGVGTAILEFLVREARGCGLTDCRLNAQTHALGFYARRGFKTYGEGFMEGGIPHRSMRRRL